MTVVAVDAVEVLGEYGLTALNAASNARLLGFLPDDRKLASRDADHVRGLFGFAEVHIPAHGHYPLPVDVLFEKVTYTPCVPRGADLPTLRRNDIWHNSIRNRRIARLARALHENDSSMLRPFRRTAKAVRGRNTRRVAVLVENIEHGLQTAKKLPGWPLITGPDVYLKGFARKDRLILDSVCKASASADYGIFTVGAADQIDPCQIDVLIRADAGLDLPPLDDSKLIVPNSVDHRLLLVDWDDHCHHELGRWTRKRQKAYRDRGWNRPGADPVEERVKAFLARQPKV